MTKATTFHGTLFSKIFAIQECQYCQLHFSCAIRKELDQIKALWGREIWDFFDLRFEYINLFPPPPPRTETSHGGLRKYTFRLQIQSPRFIPSPELKTLRRLSCMPHNYCLICLSLEFFIVNPILSDLAILCRLWL